MSNGLVPQSTKINFRQGEKSENGQNHSSVMAFDTTERSMDNYNAWNNYLRGETKQNGEAPKNVEVHVAPEPTELTPHEIRKSMHEAEVKSVELAADVLEQIKGMRGVNEAGFAARGEMRFNSESENTEMVFEEEITAPLPDNPGKQYLFERKEEVEEFKDKADVSRPLKLVDFGFFFSTVFGGLRGALGGRKAPSIPVGGAMVNLARDEIFFKYKKPQTAEEKEKHARQVANKRSFFDSLRFGRAMSVDKLRNKKQQLEATNKQAGVTNTSYEGTLDESGQILENVAAAAEIGNSQKSAEQLKQEKQKKLQLFSKGKGKSGPGISFSSDKAHNFNNAAKLAG